MRKVFGAALLIGLEAIGAKIMEVAICSALLEPPWIFMVFSIMALTASLIYMPEIKRMLDRKERQIERGKAKLLAAKRHAERDKHTFYGQPFFGDVTERDNVITAQVIRPPSAWHTKVRLWMMGIASWLASHRIWLINRPLMPERLLRWLARKMGYRWREC